jgi:hypothetical protein
MLGAQPRIDTGDGSFFNALLHFKMADDKKRQIMGHVTTTVPHLIQALKLTPQKSWFQIECMDDEGKSYSISISQNEGKLMPTIDRRSLTEFLADNAKKDVN